MPVTLTIKQVPDALAEKLRVQAAHNHRSLQGELMSILESVVSQQEVGKNKDYIHQRAKQFSNDIDERSSCDLLAELDSIVAGSCWGNADILGREQANGRGAGSE